MKKTPEERWRRKERKDKQLRDEQIERDMKEMDVITHNPLSILFTIIRDEESHYLSKGGE